MTLKEELEILRGEPIEEFPCAPEDIPCIETSDAEKLCKHPVVSVSMITYNHEPYIRQAIEGVMMQKTDFEFELIIGEDCSQDKTREICFEYQKKYPDKIRVLWWHENVSKLGGNARRCRARCRGEFVALCEGDDYWIDPLKLQKQVDVMRKYPSVGYCVTGAKVKCEIPKDHPRLKVFKIAKWYDDDTFDFDMGRYRPGLIPQDEFWENRRDFPRTATVMFRVKSYNMLVEKFEIFSWRLRCGDVLLWTGFPSAGDAYYIPDRMAVYRLNFSGVTMTRASGNLRGHLENAVVTLYFSIMWSGVESLASVELVQAIINRRVMIYQDDLNSGHCDIKSVLRLTKIMSNRWQACSLRIYVLLSRINRHIQYVPWQHGGQMRMFARTLAIYFLDFIGLKSAIGRLMHKKTKRS